ncbi:hypothetical protein [Bradyrhizobium sp. USDA 3315]
MDQPDFRTSDGAMLTRLAGVKRVITDFIARRHGDRVALVLFGTKAYVQAVDAGSADRDHIASADRGRHGRPADRDRRHHRACDQDLPGQQGTGEASGPAHRRQ